jgi:cytochrome b561
LMPRSGLGFSMLAVILGSVLGGAAVFMTKMEREEAEWFYTPNKYFGFVVLSLIIGRIVYRLSVLDRISFDTAGAPDLPLHPAGRVLLLILLVYYGVYNVGVLLRCRR